jgi:hypothetical protein
MKSNEKQAMINTYKNQFNHYLMSNGSEYEELQLNGMKNMMELFFSKKEINSIENEIRINNNQYRKDLFLVVESWLTQIEKEKGVKEYLFTWDMKGLKKVKFNYDYLLDEYKGLRGAIEILENTLQKAA